MEPDSGANNEDPNSIHGVVRRHMKQLVQDDYCIR